MWVIDPWFAISLMVFTVLTPPVWFVFGHMTGYLNAKHKVENSPEFKAFRERTKR